MVRGSDEVQIGETIVAAQEPDWREVQKTCSELLARSRDLRVIVYLTLASLKLHGIPGLRDGMALLRGILETAWEHAYPRLDPDPDFGPLERINILQALCVPPGSYGDFVMFDRRLRETPLCRSRGGSFSLRDVQVARGEIKAPPNPDKPPAQLQTIDAAFMAAPLPELQETAAALGEALGHVKAMGSILSERAGDSHGLELNRLEKTLWDMKGVVDRYLAKRGGGTAPAGADGNDGAAPGTNGPHERGEEGAGMAISGEVRSVQDIGALIDQICGYYERFEPSSPVPLMLKATRRLVGRNFSEIMKILTPDLFAQITAISEAPEEGDGSA